MKKGKSKGFVLIVERKPKLMSARLFEEYKKKLKSKLQKELGIQNIMAVPRMEKVIVNAGIGKVLQQEPKRLEELIEIVRKITGQQPVKTKARKAVASFKIRAGQVIGLAVTLRGKRMYEFYDRLVNVALPRTRDFRGLSKKGFDGHGNYSLGIRDQLVFPEMADEENASSFSLEVTIVTNTEKDEQAYQLLKDLGFPFND